MSISNKLTPSKCAKLMLRSFSFMGKYRKKYILGLILGSAEIITAYITPYLYKQLVILVSPNNQNQPQVILILLATILLLLAPVICLGKYWQRTSTAIGVGEMRKQVFYHIEHLCVTQSMEHKTGDYITRMTNDVQRAGMMFNSYSIIAFIKFIIFAIGSSIVLFYYEWKIALLSIGISLLSFFVSIILNPTVRKLELEARQTTATSVSCLVETLQDMPIVRVFLLKDILKNKYEKFCKDIFKKRVKFRTLNGISDGLVYLLDFFARPIGFVIGVLYMLGDNLNIEDIVFMAGIMAIMSEGMRNFGIFMQFIQPGIVSSQRVFEILDKPIEKQYKYNNTKEDNIDCSVRNAVDMFNVSFTYPQGKQILHNVSLSIKKGESIAIVGGSGGGKSTILKLLQAFYQPDSGEIRLFNIPMKDLSLYDIRSLSTYVPQENTMFDGSIEENIRLGKPNCSDEEVIEAAKKADIHNFIISLEDGYDTLVGEKGLQISGGQRQKIAIARAILKDAPIILLDEVTASLDSQSETEVYNSLKYITKNKTTIIVAHRLSTIRKADRIIVMEQGNIVEIGTHDELFEMDGRYRELLEI